MHLIDSINLPFTRADFVSNLMSIFIIRYDFSKNKSFIKMILLDFFIETIFKSKEY